MPRPIANVSTEMIRSRQNAQLKNLRQRLARPGYAEDGLIAIEGEHLLLEAARSGLRIDTLFLREDRLAESDWAALGSPVTFTVGSDAFDHACATECPQGVAALVEVPQWSCDSLLERKDSRLVILAGLQDPGNVGTIIRTAEAFGATGILLTPGSVHPWNQKVLRASAGSSFRLPVLALPSIEWLHTLRREHISIYGCTSHVEGSYREADLSRPFALVIGNEGAGIPADVMPFCTGMISITGPGQIESLNAGIAASILLYEASRQRGEASIQSKP